MAKIKYTQNQILGNNNIKFIKEIEPYISPKNKIFRRGKFLCHCGKNFSAIIAKVKSDITKSCGCRKNSSNIIKYCIDQEIGDNNIKFIKEVNPYKRPDGREERKALFLCHCGNEWETTIHQVSSNDIVSCGCKRFGKSNHGYKHGLSKHLLYVKYNSMIKRCYNKNDKSFKIYGGRGITVCEEWKNDFKAFYDWSIANGWTKDLTIDRIDNNKGYEPSNCRWATLSIQNRNKRKQENRTSQYVGIYYSKRDSVFISKICVNNKQKHIGSFIDEFDAAQARDQYIIDNKLVGFTMNNVL